MSANMIARSEKLLPGSELRRLRSGSYEEKIEEAAVIVRLLLGETPFQVVATREDGAIVYSDGRFLRMVLSESGPVLRDFDAEVFTPGNVRSFVEREATRVVDLFLGGSVKRAVGLLEMLVPLAAFPNDDVSRVSAVVFSPRLWRRVLEARREFVVRFLAESSLAGEGGQLHPKFGKLYDESIALPTQHECDCDEDQVIEDLRIVLNRLGSLRDEVSESLESVAGLLSNPDDEVTAMFAQFAGDLLSDLRSLHETASKAAEMMDDVRSRGKLCDTIVEGLRDREVASRFAVVVANRMIEAN